MTAIQTRNVSESDKPFVFSSWLRHYKNRSYFAKRIRNSIFYKWHHLIVERALSADTSVAMIAHPEGEPDVILGFVVGEKTQDGDVLHFVYVKPAFRKMGIGRHLIKKAGLIDANYFTHWTFDIEDLLSKLPNLNYDPYRI